MIKFNVGARRPANDGARPEHTDFANDLVRRTLAQHGLLPKSDGGLGGITQSSRSSMETVLDGFGRSLVAKDFSDPPLPDGAEFRRDVFACAAGSRTYRTYVPSTAAKGIEGVVLMLHGCTQTPEDFAAGTGMNAIAEARRLIIIYPHQSRGENAQSCWNWFRRGDQKRDRGEPAILAGMVRKVMAEFDLPPGRTFVAGLSAGAAMAVILGETYPDLFSAVGTHSGLPYGAAKDVPSAFEAMAGRRDLTVAPPAASPVPTIVIHGTADATVHVSNADRIGRAVIDRAGDMTIETETRSMVSGRDVHRSITTTIDGAPVLEQWRIEGLGHAWSGGQPDGSYTDPAGPDASAEIVRFFFETAIRDR
ncbi:PHB depolymerase family esterase [Notoacmeibacter sp. MSK16QG-6]|uniref:extracellular catalytic domain type 1 short-chain-length polyhydroxyalkanoate depolymerase n=1 Tax=Notoacmeibacter sp. MSK16QG-6 TaxID=2957982 RepID=UPI0020A1EE95|nr:PHB depolymerase family esterase [Notoacmeibacter sp. MSK16QG-6]MCP1200855.1 PHB depolymerase family esterase [Notoacmeibacter sp. MSK16QG-6]